MRIKELIDMGCKNVNPHNVPIESKEREGGEVPFEDRTATVYEIHDIDNDEWLIISKSGPRDGQFLWKQPWPYKGVDIYRPLVFRHRGDDGVHGAATIDMCLGVIERLAHIDYQIDRHVREHADYKLGGPGSANDPKIKAGLKNPEQRFVFAGSPESWQSMKEIKPPPIPDTLLAQWQRLFMQLRHIIGSDVQDTGAPNPHQISATESAHRGGAREERKADRQEIMGEFLAWVARNFLLLYKKFATQSVLVRVMGEMGPQYKQINPADVPGDIDIYLDIQGEAQDAKAERTQAAMIYRDWRVQMAAILPTNWVALDHWFARELGIRHSESFDGKEPMPLPMGQEEEPGGMPGIAKERNRPPGPPSENERLQFVRPQSNMPLGDTA